MKRPETRLRPLIRVKASAALLSPWRLMSSSVRKLATSEVVRIGSGMFLPRMSTSSTCVSSLEARGPDCDWAAAVAWAAATWGAISAEVASRMPLRGRNNLFISGTLIWAESRKCGGGARPPPSGSAGRAGGQTAGPPLPPSVVGVLDRADVARVGQEAAEALDVGVRGASRLVGAVDEGAAERSGESGAVVGAGVEQRGHRRGVDVRVVGERRAAGQDHGGEGRPRRRVVDVDAAGGRGGQAHDAVQPDIVRRGVGDEQIVARAAAADDGPVGELRIGTRRGAGAAGLEGAVTAVGALDDDAELKSAVVTDVGVDAVVIVARQDQVLAVDGAAEELDAVVRAVV